MSLYFNDLSAFQRFFHLKSVVTLISVRYWGWQVERKLLTDAGTETSGDYLRCCLT